MITKEKLINYLENDLLDEISNTQAEAWWYDRRYKDGEPYFKDFDTSLECLQDILEHSVFQKMRLKVSLKTFGTIT